MKKFLTLIVLVLFSISTFAQDVEKKKKHDIAITYGTISGMEFVVGVWIDLIDALGDRSDNFEYKGNFSAQYHYQLEPWLRIGGKFIWEGNRHDIYTDTKKDVKCGYGEHDWVSLLASGQFTYLNKKWVKLYSGVDFGVGMLALGDYYDDQSYHEDDTDYTFMPAFNITPFGLIVGKSLYGTFESNIGFDAFFKVGLGYRF